MKGLKWIQKAYTRIHFLIHASQILTLCRLSLHLCLRKKSIALTCLYNHNIRKPILHSGITKENEKPIIDDDMKMFMEHKMLCCMKS